MVSSFSDFKNSNGIDISNYFGTKIISQLTIEELAYIHLDLMRGCQVLQSGRLSSGLYDLVETVSASFNNNRTKQYTPLLGCFSILDQVGGVYERNDKATSYKNGIKKSLDLFSSFNNSADLETLVTLRHGIFHDGSLLYSNRNTGTNVCFRMVVNSGSLLTPPIKTWDGIFRNDLKDYTTRIDLKELQSLTTEVVRECRRLLVDGVATLNISNPVEFYHKYLFSQ